MVARTSKPQPAAQAPNDDAALDFGLLPGLVGYVLRRAQLKVFDDFIRAFEPLGLRPAQFSALLLIEANPGRSQREIAAGLGIQRPNFVAMMDGFEKRGLARRTRSAVDRRSHALMLTPEGAELLVRAKAVVAEHEARVTSGLDDAGRARLVALLKAM